MADRESRWTVAEKEQPKRPVRDLRNIDGKIVDVNRAPKAGPLEGLEVVKPFNKDGQIVCTDPEQSITKYGVCVATPDAPPDLPPPVLTTLEPATVELGSPDFMLHVQGTGFAPESEILWNTSPEPTTFVSETELTTDVDMSTASVPVNIPIEVQTGDVKSNALSFTFTAAAPAPPTLTSLTPNTAPVGPGFSITVAGTGFTANTVLFVNGTAWASAQTVYLNATSMGLTTNTVSTPGTYTIQAAEGAMGVKSNSLTFTYTAAA